MEIKYINRNENKKKDDFIQRRQTIPDSVKPKTLDEKNRSIEVVAATETPSLVWDPVRYEEVNEILLMSGVELPKDDNIPLTVEHYRSADAVIGSFREMRIDAGALVGRVFFASDPDADKYFTRTKEGHLNSFSITYPAGDGRESVFIPKNETATIQGRVFSGPLLVTTRWQPKSLGLVIYPADSNAKSRSENKQIKEKEIEKMDPRLRAFLERSGLKKEATEDEAWAFFNKMGERNEPNLILINNSQKPKDEKPVDVDAIRAEAIKNENLRITEINALCDRAEYPKDKRPEMLKPEVTVEAARSKIIDFVLDKKADKNLVPVAPYFQVGLDERDKFRAAADDAMVIRSGIAKVEKPAVGAEELRGLSMTEIARHCLRVAGQKASGLPLEVVGRAMTSSDFPYILANVSNKSLMVGWDTAPTTWQKWCGTGSVNNFLTHTQVSPSEFSDLEEIPEGSEYKFGKRTETREQYQVVTYGKMAAITRQAVINDDLNAITSNFMGMGEAAARKVNELPYAVLVANALMGDGVALFDVSTHANYVTSGGAPGENTLKAMVLAMGIQKDLQGLRSLNISAEYIIMPRALEGAAEVFFQSTAFSDNSTVATDSSFASTRANIYAGTRFQRIYEGYFDAHSLAAGWFAAARKGRTINVYFLNGVQAPYMETQQGWTVDGVEYKVRIDAGAKAIDWRGLYWNDGA
jgi:hypothetical protein